MIHHYAKGVAVPAKSISAIRQALQNILQVGRAGTDESTEIDTSLSLYSAKHSAQLLGRLFDVLSQSRTPAMAISHRSERCHVG
jgi:hypothetical protein